MGSVLGRSGLREHVGQPSAPDSEIMEYASQDGLIVFTHDLDFGALLANRKSRQPSVIQIRAQDVLPTAR